MNVLIDTSVWVAHFRNRNPALIDLLHSDQALIHPWVVAELACGTLPAPRFRTLQDLELLRPSCLATLSEIRTLIENERLQGLGCGLVDLALLASTLLSPNARLWSLDQRLATIAQRFNIHFLP